MITGQKLYELSQRFQAKCGNLIDYQECEGCKFKAEFRCPEFFFHSLEHANQVVDFIYEGDPGEPEMLVGEAIAPYKFTSPKFVDCTFNDCEIYGSDVY